MSKTGPMANSPLCEKCRLVKPRRGKRTQPRVSTLGYLSHQATRPEGAQEGITPRRRPNADRHVMVERTARRAVVDVLSGNGDSAGECVSQQRVAVVLSWFGNDLEGLRWRRPRYQGEHPSSLGVGEAPGGASASPRSFSRASVTGCETHSGAARLNSPKSSPCRAVLPSLELRTPNSEQQELSQPDYDSKNTLSVPVVDQRQGSAVWIWKEI
jgi:hypothetical protein